MDPKQLKRMMESMGIRSSEIEAERVIIQGKDKDIVIENPQVMAIEAQGARSFQVVGTVREVDKVKVEISDDDVELVAAQAGADRESARTALEESNGDIAAAILKLKGGKQQ